jgi:hypothetical protein
LSSFTVKARVQTVASSTSPFNGEEPSFNPEKTNGCVFVIAPDTPDQAFETSRVPSRKSWPPLVPMTRAA